MSWSESQESGRLTVRLVQSLGQVVDTNELEWESRVGKINHLDLPPDQMISLVLLLIFPTLDTHSNSFVFTTWPNDFTSLTVNLPHSVRVRVKSGED
jgi:hypothetical protein